MDWTPEQRAIFAHPLDAHALVRAAPGSGKTTTLVGRVQHMVSELGVDPTRIRVVMFNKGVRETFHQRLVAAGVRGVLVSTFDALGYEVLRAAERFGWLSRRLDVRADAAMQLAREAWRPFRDQIDDAEEVARAVSFWKAHLIPPDKAAFPSNPALVDAYAGYEALRRQEDRQIITFEDMVYTAVGVLRARRRSPLEPFDHLLVDEFQDVNPGRVELCQRLLHPTATLMAVGDEDQAINEWCGANPSFLREFEASFGALPTRRYPLPRSFRLGPVLADAANRLIGHNPSRSPGVVDGGGRHPGAVALVKDAAATVRHLRASGVPAGDIAVLYRGRSQGAATLAALVSAGVPIDTEDADLLRRGRGPELALGYLHHATSDDPVEFDAAWRVVCAPERYIRKDAFTQMVKRGGKRGLRALLADRALAAEAGMSFPAIKAMRTLSGLLTRMGRAHTAGAALAMLADEVDVAEQFETWIRTDKEREVALATFAALQVLLDGLNVRPADAAAAVAAIDPSQGAPPHERVRVTTIHKAKGLEWRHVVLPALAEGFSPATEVGKTPGSLDHPHGLPQGPFIEEERRIFYVGITRASEVVHLDVPAEDPSRFLTECGAVRPVAAPTRRRRVSSVDELVRATVARAGGQEQPAAMGKKWSEEDDDALAAAWAGGGRVSVLAVDMERSTGSIVARLVRLALVESREEARARG